MAHIGLSAGGTGGHLFPAVAVARLLHQRGHKVSLLCDHRVKDMSDEHLFDHVLTFKTATPSRANIFKKIGAMVGIGKQALKAAQQIKQLEIDAVIGFGGYPTVAPLLGAHMAKKPIILHEGNAVLGRANRLLARFASHIATHFETTKYLSRFNVPTSVTGMPVREAIIAVQNSDPIRNPDAPLEVLIFGGSLGARFFSDLGPEMFGLLSADELARIKLTQQCRQEDLERVREAYLQLDANWAARVTLNDFFKDIATRIAKADLVICRAGASTVAELAMVGRAGFYVPLPGSLDQDQAHNAKQMIDIEGGWAAEQEDVTPEKMAEKLRRFLNHRSDLVDASSKARLIAREQAANQVADCVEAVLSDTSV